MSHCLFSIYTVYILLSVEFLDFLYASRYTTEEAWTGKWFPEEPNLMKNHHTAATTESLISQMGVKNPDCDDGTSNLSTDWDGSFQDYICLNPRNRFVPNPDIHGKIEFENIPKMYNAPHYCLQKTIEYKSPIPTFGPHRPLWPKYGEYKFVPKQRWLHSLEHGAIVALYHPCADLGEINHLKNLVRSCLRRHVITPSSDLTPERPFALLAWGVRFTMPSVDSNEIRRFIKEHALRGPEKLSKEGQYEFLLMKEAKVVSDYEDSVLCP